MTALPSCTLVSVGPSPSPSSLDWLLEMVLGTDFDRWVGQQVQGWDSCRYRCRCRCKCKVLDRDWYMWW